MGGLESDNIVVGYDSSVNISALGSHHINTLAWLRIVSFVVWDEKRGKPLELFNSVGSYSMFPWLLDGNDDGGKYLLNNERFMTRTQ